MFKYIALLLIIFWQKASFAVEEFRYYSNAQYIKVKIVHIDKLRVNELCLKKSSCKALQIARGSTKKVQADQATTYGNPGANYCWEVGAKNRILKDTKNNEYDFCVFEDGSMIDAWNLYSKHYPPARIK